VKSIVIYGSRHGNTHKIAEAIATELRRHGQVEMLAVEVAPIVPPRDADLIVVGGPTEAHRMSMPVAEFFDRIGRGTWEGVAAAGFDTRLGWPVWLSGSAASSIAARLSEAGARVIAPEGSFVVAGKFPALQPGELKRATEWAAALAEKATALVPSAAAG
jgi:flavodoxin